MINPNLALQKIGPATINDDDLECSKLFSDDVKNMSGA